MELISLNRDIILDFSAAISVIIRDLIREKQEDQRTRKCEGQSTSLGIQIASKSWRDKETEISPRKSSAEILILEFWPLEP